MAYPIPVDGNGCGRYGVHNSGEVLTTSRGVANAITDVQRLKDPTVLLSATEVTTMRRLADERTTTVRICILFREDFPLPRIPVGSPGSVLFYRVEKGRTTTVTSVMATSGFVFTKSTTARSRAVSAGLVSSAATMTSPLARTFSSLCTRYS